MKSVSSSIIVLVVSSLSVQYIQSYKLTLENNTKFPALMSAHIIKGGPGGFCSGKKEEQVEPHTKKELDMGVCSINTIEALVCEEGGYYCKKKATPWSGAQGMSNVTFTVKPTDNGYKVIKK